MIPRVLILLALLAFGRPVFADAFEFAAPTGWGSDAELASSVAKAVGEQRHFGGLPVQVQVQAWTRGQAGGFYFITAFAEETGDGAGAELERFRALGPADAQASSREQDGVLIAEQRWIDADSQSTREARLLLFANQDGRLRALQGECVLAKDAATDAVSACRNALASIRVTAPLAERKPLRRPDAAAPAIATEPSVERRLEPLERAEAQVSATDDQPRRVLYRGEPEPRSATRRTTLLLGAGAGVILVGLWLSGRARQRDPENDPSPGQGDESQ